MAQVLGMAVAVSQDLADLVLVTLAAVSSVWPQLLLVLTITNEVAPSRVHACIIGRSRRKAAGPASPALA